jgi:hypothetical protein
VRMRGENYAAGSAELVYVPVLFRANSESLPPFGLCQCAGS